MGLTRKLFSLGTAGLVDFRSDKERTAAYTQRGARAAEAGNRLLRVQNEILAAQAATIAAQAKRIAEVPPQTQTFDNRESAAPGSRLAPGWYGGDTPGPLRYWNGVAWTGGKP